MYEDLEITSEQEVLIESANKLYAAHILTDEEYGTLINRIDSIKDSE